MTSPTVRRLIKDLEQSTFQTQPVENDLYTWVALVDGPKGTPFEGGFFSLVLLFDDEYPQHPPEVAFVSEVFHPNVYENGDICLDILKNKWLPSYSVNSLLLSIQTLLGEPNENSPANAEAAELYVKNKEEYEKRVRKCVEATWENINI